MGFCGEMWPFFKPNYGQLQVKRKGGGDGGGGGDDGRRRQKRRREDELLVLSANKSLSPFDHHQDYLDKHSKGGVKYNKIMGFIPTGYE